MKTINNSDLINEQINNLEEDLLELLEKGEKLLKHRCDSVDETIKKLIHMNTKKSKTLANDILDIREDILTIEEEYYNNYQSKEDPFTTLYNEDEDN